MDLEAAKLGIGKAGRMARVGMVMCFVAACGLLLASLAQANAHTSTQFLNSRTLLADRPA
jgi:hypothetical protein